MKRWKMPVRLEEDAIGAYVEYGDAVQAIEEVHQSYGGLPSKCDEQQKRERCEHCGATLNVSGCQRCGAPVCCPQCCQIQSLTERVRKAERERDDALQVHVDRRYRCPDCNGQRVCPSNGVAMWCTLCGGTGAVSFDPSLDK